MTTQALAALTLALSACGTTSENPAFVSTEVLDVRVFGGDCSTNRCVQVIAPVDGTEEGEGSCELFGPGDPDNLEPIAESGPLEMVPGEGVVWQIELPEDAPSTPELNPVCEPMSEG